jgi:toxin ParE1/3/4
MSRAIIKRPQAEVDLIGHYAFLSERVSIENADRFLNAVENILNLLAKSPGIGTVHRTNKPELANIRFLPVSKFRRFLVFYETFDDRIELVRVIHGARDLDRILGDKADQ